MRRMIFAGIIAASVGVPAAALAKPNLGVNTNGSVPSQALDSQQLLRDRVMRAPTTLGATIGGGMEGGNEPGHVTGPGNAPIDNSTRGPINDVQPGRGSADTRQSASPKPAY